MGAVIVVGGTAGIGLEIVKHYAGQGRDVILTGRDPARAAKVAAEVAGEVAGSVRSLGFDVSLPETIAPALEGAGPIRHLVLAAIERDSNSVDAYDITAAVHLATLKLVGYTEVVHALSPNLAVDASIVIFGGMARVRPYPGSTTVTTVNAGVLGLVRALSIELAPIRVNSIHPGIVGDSPFWMDKPPQVLESFRSGTLTGRLATMADVVDATTFLLENGSINGVDLTIDGGWR